MEYKSLSFTPTSLSRIVLGCDSAPFHSSYADASKVLSSAYSLGINVFDTAAKYLGSEEAIGHFLSMNKLRDKVAIISKGCHPTKEGKSTLFPDILRNEIEGSLKKLCTPFIDLYLLHRDSPNMDLEGMLSVLNEYRKKGALLAYGGSNWSLERIEEANRICLERGYEPFKASSPNYSLAKWEKDPWGSCYSLSGASKKKERDTYSELKMPLFVYSPLARGFLSGRIASSMKEDEIKAILDPSAFISYYSKENMLRLKRAEEVATKHSSTVPNVAISFLLSSSMNIFPIIGSKRKESMEENIKSLDLRLSQEEIDYLDLIN